jgi:hypothetical protein
MVLLEKSIPNFTTRTQTEFKCNGNRTLPFVSAPERSNLEGKPDTIDMAEDEGIKRGLICVFSAAGSMQIGYSWSSLCGIYGFLLGLALRFFTDLKRS